MLKSQHLAVSDVSVFHELMNSFDLEGLVQCLGAQRKKRKPNGIGKGKTRIPHILMSVSGVTGDSKSPGNPQYDTCFKGEWEEPCL